MNHHYHYSLGADESTQKTATGVEYVLTPTAQNDGFTSLFAAYRAAYPASMTEGAFARELCRVNGVAFAIVDIERWVFGKSGERFRFVPGNSPQNALENKGRSVPDDLKGKGWAHFGEGNMILLPNIPRADGKTPGAAPVLPPAPPALPPAPPVATLPPSPPVRTLPPPLKKAEEEPWWQSPYVLGGAAFLLVAVALTMDDKKKKPAGASLSPSASSGSLS